jgi:hydroxymethylbilane synthase
MLPAPAQGIVGIEVRADDVNTGSAVAAIDHAPTHACVLAERALLAALGADCHSPVGALATPGAVLLLRAELLSEDGDEVIAGSLEGSDPVALGRALAADLLARAPAGVRRLFTP